MRVECISTLTWEEAPDTITPRELSQILGIGIEGARKIFDSPDFPKVSKKIIGNIGIADKEAARLYIQGVRVNKNNNKDYLLNMIYLELKEINKKEKIRKEGNI